eukprot:7371281-Prymnesium_polylepis.1
MEVEVGTEAPRKCLAARRHPSGSTPNSKPAATTASFPWVLAVASRRPAAARHDVRRVAGQPPVGAASAVSCCQAY